MITISKVEVPANTTVLLVDENVAVFVTFESIGVSIGGKDDLSNTDDRIGGSFLNQKTLAIAKDEKLYGYYQAPSGSQIVSMMIIPQH